MFGQRSFMLSLSLSLMSLPTFRPFGECLDLAALLSWGQCAERRISVVGPVAPGGAGQAVLHRRLLRQRREGRREFQRIVIVKY